MSERCPQFHFQYQCRKDAGHPGRHRTQMDDGSYVTWIEPFNERIFALWTEGRKPVVEYKITITAESSDLIILREYSHRQGTVNWLPENKIMRFSRRSMLEALDAE